MAGKDYPGNLFYEQIPDGDLLIREGNYVVGHTAAVALPGILSGLTPSTNEVRAVAAISAGAVVSVSGSNDPPDAVPADPSGSTNVYGVAQSAALPGSTVEVLTVGTITDPAFAGIANGQPVFLGAGGSVTTSPALADGEKCIQIGVGLGSNTILFNPQPSITVETI